MVVERIRQIRLAKVQILATLPIVSRQICQRSTYQRKRGDLLADRPASFVAIDFVLVANRLVTCLKSGQLCEPANRSRKDCGPPGLRGR